MRDDTSTSNSSRFSAPAVSSTFTAAASAGLNVQTVDDALALDSSTAAVSSTFTQAAGTGPNPQILELHLQAVTNAEISTTRVNGIELIDYLDENGNLFNFIDGQRSPIETLGGHDKGLSPVQIPVRFEDIDGVTRMGIASDYEASLPRTIGADLPVATPDTLSSTTENSPQTLDSEI